MMYQTHVKKSVSHDVRVWVRRGVVALLSLGFLLFIFKGVSFGLLGLRLYREAESIYQVANGGLEGNLSIVQDHLLKMSMLFETLESELRPLEPFLDPLEGWTRAGTTVAHANELAAVGYELTQIGLQGLALSNTGADSSSISAALATIAINSPEDFQLLAKHTEQLMPKVETLQRVELLPPLADALDNGTGYVNMGAALLKLAPHLSDLLGSNKPVTYLLLIQNNHELRATGGFITAVGKLTIDKGEIIELDFKDSYEVASDDVDHPWAPEPMRRFLGIDLMFLRDANWSPDLPTAAQMIRMIYMRNEGVPLDGVITLDLHAVELLMDGIGPLRIPDVGEALTGQNVIKQIKLFWQEAPGGKTQTGDGLNEWWQHRKDFMPVLGEAAIQRVQHGSVNYVDLATALHTALEERAVQIWVRFPEAASVLASLGWDGSLRPLQDGDFLALIDSNFGYNKVDSILTRSLRYEVEWPEAENAPGLARATITYKHPAVVPGHQCDITPRYSVSYDDMAARCYFNFVRLYVPAGSRLLDVAGVDLTTAASHPGENGTEVFSAYVTVPPGTEHVVTFQYELPARIQESGYRLAVRRQAGTDALPILATIGAHSTEFVVTQGFTLWKYPEN